MLLELLLVGGLATAPIDTTAIKIFEENKIELVIPTPDPMTTLPEPEPVITPQEQLQINIDTNVNNCDESLYWISAENATCLAKPVYTPKTVQRSSNTIRNGSRATSGWYESGSCTDGAQRLAPWVGRWRNAKTWDDMARAEGYRVDSTPQVGAVFVDNGGYYGHVGVVIGVSGNNVTVRDMNYRNKYEWTVRTVSASSFVYIHP